MVFARALELTSLNPKWESIFKELYGDLLGERNVRLPREFATEAERYPFIANKQFFYFAEFDDPRMVLRRDLADLVMRHYKAGQKVNEFLAAAVG